MILSILTSIAIAVATTVRCQCYACILSLNSVTVTCKLSISKIHNIIITHDDDGMNVLGEWKVYVVHVCVV